MNSAVLGYQLVASHGFHDSTDELLEAEDSTRVDYGYVSIRADSFIHGVSATMGNIRFIDFASKWTVSAIIQVSVSDSGHISPRSLKTLRVPVFRAC